MVQDESESEKGIEDWNGRQKERQREEKKARMKKSCNQIPKSLWKFFFEKNGFHSLYYKTELEFISNSEWRGM